MLCAHRILRSLTLINPFLNNSECSLYPRSVSPNERSRFGSETPSLSADGLAVQLPRFIPWLFCYMLCRGSQSRMLSLMTLHNRRSGADSKPTLRRPIAKHLLTIAVIHARSLSKVEDEGYQEETSLHKLRVLTCKRSQPRDDTGNTNKPFRENE